MLKSLGEKAVDDKGHLKRRSKGKRAHKLTLIMNSLPWRWHGLTHEGRSRQTLLHLSMLALGINISNTWPVWGHTLQGTCLRHRQALQVEGLHSPEPHDLLPTCSFSASEVEHPVGLTCHRLHAHVRWMCGSAQSATCHTESSVFKLLSGFHTDEWILNPE